jgi:hypothetical protein
LAKSASQKGEEAGKGRISEESLLKTQLSEI